MNKKPVALISAVIALFAPTHVSAYELGTHARLTEKAYERSSLVKDPELLKSLGLRDESNPFGEAYYDVSGTEVRERKQDDFEKLFIPNAEEKLTIKGWLLRGAIREDDVLEPDNGQPVDDPYNTDNKLADNRVLNHFYDPVLHRPLTTILGAVLGKRAPDWGSGSQDAFSAPSTPETGRRNHFSILDAREALYRALTGRDKDGSEVAKTKDERNKYWATAFRALGDVAHTVEDMAQPQHTRTDRHAGVYRRVSGQRRLA